MTCLSLLCGCLVNSQGSHSRHSRMPEELFHRSVQCNLVVNLRRVLQKMTFRLGLQASLALQQRTLGFQREASHRLGRRSVGVCQ